MMDISENSASDDPRILVVAFNGWSDAGNAATHALKHLQSYLKLEPVHTISAEGYIDLQMYRPTVTKLPTGERMIEWPDAQLFAPLVQPEKNPQLPETEPRLADPAAESAPFADDVPPAEADDANPVPATVTNLQGVPVNNIFLLDATEPAHHWLSYADEVLELIDVWQIDLVVFLGSMFSDAPHTRPIQVRVTSEDPEIRSEFEAEDNNYEGPIGITGVLNHHLTAADIPSVSLWAQVPHYVHSAPSPKATLAIIDRCEELLDIVVPRGELLDEAGTWEDSINHLASQDDEMTRYIERLEEARDSVEGPGSTGEAIAHEFEKFLQLPHDEPGDDQRSADHRDKPDEGSEGDDSDR